MQEIIQRLSVDYAPSDNPYIRGLEDGHLSREDFLETQVQFYFAVVFFSRPMAVLAAKIPSSRQRVEILRNVWEEHGEGDTDGRHGASFLELLHRLEGLSLEDVERRALWPEVRAFNTCLVGTCTLDDWEVGAGMLGIIEHQFAEISTRIGRAIVERGWLPEGRIVHYALHQELDQRHSADFFEALEPAWERDERVRYRIEQGLQLGAYVFDRLYRGLWEARTRRVESAIARPQDHLYAE